MSGIPPQKQDKQPGVEAEMQPRPFCTKPPFWFFAITVFFMSYGPTWNGLCASAPKLVVEVEYDHFTGGRFRHGTRLVRWRPDKAPRQCRMEQVEQAGAASLKLLTSFSKRRGTPAGINRL